MKKGCLNAMNKLPKAIYVPVLEEMSCLYTSVQLMVCLSFADWFQTAV